MNPDGTNGHDQAEQRRQAFADGQAVSRQEHTAELIEAAVEAQKRGFAALMNGLDFVEKVDVSDPVRARLVEAYKQGMLRLSAAIVNAEGQSQGPKQEPLRDPFFQSSSPSSTSYPQPSRLSKNSTGLESEQVQQPGLPQSPKRGPGRPKGRKNTPKPGDEGRGPS